MKFFYFWTTIERERQSVVARCDISSTWYSICCQCYRCATYLLILFSRWICLKFLLNHWNVHTPVDSFSEQYRSTYARCVRNKVSLWYAIYARDMMKSRKARIPIFCEYCEIHTIPCAPRTIQNSFFRRSSLFDLTSRHMFIKWANPSKNGSNGNVLPARENWLGDDITHVSDTFYNINVMWWVCTERERAGVWDTLSSFELRQQCLYHTISSWLRQVWALTTFNLKKMSSKVEEEKQRRKKPAEDEIQITVNDKDAKILYSKNLSFYSLLFLSLYSVSLPVDFSASERRGCA